METAVREKSDGLYKIKYDSLEMDEVAGDLTISNMNLSYDSSRYLEFIKTSKEPAILLNTEIMAKFRPDMRKFYYDPTKYKTYLEQLGIKYPTVRTKDDKQGGGKWFVENW